MKFRNSYHFYASITIICWALSYTFTRLSLQHFSSYGLASFRYLIASLVLLVAVLVMKIKPPQKKDFWQFFVAGAFGFALYMLFFNKGGETLTASTGSLIIATAPIITAFLARFFCKEKLLPYQWIAIWIEFAGILVITLMNGILSINVGTLWMFGAAILLSGYNLLQRRLSGHYSALQCSVYSIFAGTILLFPFAPQGLAEAATAPPSQIFYVLVLALFSSAFAYITWTKALSMAEKTSYVSNYMFLTPFLSSLLGFVIMGEIPDKATLLGGLVIFGGILLFYSKDFQEALTKKRTASSQK